MDYRKFKELESKIHAHLSALTEDNGKIYCNHCERPRIPLYFECIR